MDDFTDNIRDYVKKLWNGPSTKPDADDHHHDQNRRVPEWVRPWTLAVSKVWLGAGRGGGGGLEYNHYMQAPCI